MIARAVQLKMENWSQTKSEIPILCLYLVLRLFYLSLFYQFDEWQIIQPRDEISPLILTLRLSLFYFFAIPFSHSLFPPISLVFLPMLFALSPFDLRFIYQFSVFFPLFIYFHCRSETAWLRWATALKFMPAHILFHIVLWCCCWDWGGFEGCPAGSRGRGAVWCQCEGKRVEG